MEDNISGQGWFLVRIERTGPRQVAVLTGDHFGSGLEDAARAVAGALGSDRALHGESPVYLVKDSAVRVALGASRMKQGLKIVDCHDGARGKPCGKCSKCMEARERMFTRVILGSLELPETDLSKRLRDAVRQVIGLPWTDAPWIGPMTDEEVEEVFEELGVTPVKEGE